MKKTLLTLTIATVLSLPVATAADKASIMDSLNKTEAAHKALIPSGFAWRWTPDHIKNAKAAIAAGDMAKAKELADRAAREVELAKEQIETAEKNWEIAVPK